MPDRIEPGPEQESVWDYPRPPRVEAVEAHIEVIFAGVHIADTHQVQRLLETSHPPSYYIPPEDVVWEHLELSGRVTMCEWKGRARYYDVVVGDRRARNAAWCYPTPKPRYSDLKKHVAFYPRAMDICRVDGEQARPQGGDFYGGWITSHVVGPFKGGPGTWGW